MRPCTRRHQIDPYQQVDVQIDRLVEDINEKWGTPRWKPIVHHKWHFGPTEMMAVAPHGRLLHR
jgi:trehalose-6-phosphate synthase